MKTFKGGFLLGAATTALLLSLSSFSAGQLSAQEVESSAPDATQNEQPSARPDGDLIGRLNLTPVQIRQIRGIRQQTAEQMRVARQRMGMAQGSLDEAIYADSVDEAVIEARARDLATAQSAVARLRALAELRIRRLLSPEQLKLLREIRQEARDRTRQRGIRQNNPSAFQERQRRNNRGAGQNNVAPGKVDRPQNPTTARPGNP